MQPFTTSHRSIPRDREDKRDIEFTTRLTTTSHLLRRDHTVFTAVLTLLAYARHVNYAASQANITRQAHPSLSIRALALIALGITKLFLDHFTVLLTKHVQAVSRCRLSCQPADSFDGTEQKGLCMADFEHMGANHSYVWIMATTRANFNFFLDAA